MGTREEKRENRVLLISLGVILLVIAALAYVGFMRINPPEEIIQGQAEATTVKISGALPGRIEKIYVKEGDSVKTGDTLVHIHSSVAQAKLIQALGIFPYFAQGEEITVGGIQSQTSAQRVARAYFFLIYLTAVDAKAVVKVGQPNGVKLAEQLLGWYEKSKPFLVRKLVQVFKRDCIFNAKSARRGSSQR